MASITMHKNSKFWSARYRDGRGRRKTRSTKLPRIERKKAQALADEWERAAQGKVSASHIHRTTADIMREVTGEETATFTIKQYLLKWCADKKHKVAPATSEKYDYCIDEFLRFMGARADKPLILATETNILAFRDECIRLNSPKTVNSKTNTLGSAFRDAWDCNHLPDDITKRRKKWKLLDSRVGKERQPFSQEQVNNIIKTATGEWKGIVSFGAYTGQRLGDIVSLRWGDIEGGFICFTSQKTRRPMRVPVSEKVAEWLKFQTAKHRPEDRVFSQAYATFVKNRMKVAALSKQFGAILAALNYAPKRIFRTQGKGRKAARPFSPLSFHSFRHFLTSEMHHANVPAAVVRDIIGHDSEAVNRIYTHIGDEAKQQAFQKLLGERVSAASASNAAVGNVENGGLVHA